MNDDHTYAAEMTAEEAIQMVLKRPEMYGLQKVVARQPSEDDREALAVQAYPDGEFTSVATNLAFREAFIRGYEARAAEYRNAVQS